MDIQNLTLAGLVSIGVVNVISMYRPQMDSRSKVALAFLAAFAVGFVPVEIGNVILERAKVAIEVALASSGLYKLAQKAGGDR